MIDLPIAKAAFWFGTSRANIDSIAAWDMLPKEKGLFMPFRVALLLLVTTTVQGCGAGVAVVYDGSRKASSNVIGAYLAEQTPGIDQAAGARCIVKGMKTTEVLRLGTSDSTKITAAYRSKVEEVKLRPGVAECLAAVPVQG